MTATSPYATRLGRLPRSVTELTVAGSDTLVASYGPADAELQILMIHGFRGDHHGLEPIAACLPESFGAAEPSVRVIIPDLPGFGASTPFEDADHDVAGYSAWLTALVAALELPPAARFVLLGHSFGSIIVSAALAERSDWIRRPDDVVLVNPIGAPALEGPRGVMTRLAVLYYWLGAALPAPIGFAALRSRAVTRLISVQMAKTRDPGLRSWIHDQHDRYFGAFSDRAVVLEAFRASVGHNVREYAARVPERTLLVAADRDDITPIGAQRELVAVFPDATLEVIESVGHLIHYETPDQAADRIAAFLGARA